MTASSIGAGSAQSYSEYLESRSATPSRGDYYLSEEGLPAETPGVWQMLDSTREMLGIEQDKQVESKQLVALMEGRHPSTGEFTRQAGGDGQRAAGIDMTFSAPKSVSVVWAIGSGEQRTGIEQAHGNAVERTLDHLRENAEVVRRGAGGQQLEPARDLIAAEFRHTTARGLADGGTPDPQLHSHVVVTGVVRSDGRVAAVASRPIFQSARELGSFYRSALAQELRQQGYGITAGTGKDGRYFEMTGVPQTVKDELSSRSREVWVAAERFAAKYGRSPERNELRNVKQETRRAKIPQTRADLQQAWNQRAANQGFGRLDAQRLQQQTPGGLERAEGQQTQQVTSALTANRSTFTRSELRATVLEQGVGERTPEDVEKDVQELIASGAVIELDGGLLTTAEIRGMERQVIAHVEKMSHAGTRQITPQAREQAIQEVQERIGATLSAEQQQALQVLTGAERVGVLVGQAGTGKGVVLDAAARAEQHSGRDVYGVAVAGATAERLGRDSPGLQDRTSTLDSLVARANHGSLQIDQNTTVFFDEAGMADTERLHALTSLLSDRGATLIAAGDAKQLSSIGAGGLFEHVQQHAPTAELTEIHRTSDPAEQKAWKDLRAGRPEQAMAHYHARGQLHISHTREQAIEAAAQQWAALTDQHELSKIALISDASNQEIDRLNGRAQHLLGQRGHLGSQELPLPEKAYGLREGDRVAFTAQHHPGQGQPRVENGSRGEITRIDPDKQQATIRIDGSDREVTLQGEQQLANLRLGYAQHIHGQQGATLARVVR